MESECISYSDISFLPTLISNYLNNSEDLQHFHSGLPNFDSVQERMSSRASFSKENREVLVSALKKQYGNDTSELENSLFDSLLNQNTFTVTTGHQLCTFTGPAYFIYKILSVIKLSQQLKAQFPSKNFVPIYWMATEDHDFEEINHFFSFDEKISWSSLEQGKAVGEIKPDFTQLINELETKWTYGDNAKQLKKWFKKYAEFQNLADATRYLVRELLGEYGVLVIDANCKELKELFVESMLQEVSDFTSNASVSESSGQLNQLGYSTQVNPRTVNLFYLTDKARLRLDFDSNKGEYKTIEGNQKWTLEEIKAEISKYPERFSPNVLLRPLYQEIVLPNLSYTGGAGELSYWFQLKSMFNAHNVPFPLIMLRNSVLVLSKRRYQNLAQLGLSINDLFESFQELEAKILERFSEHNTSLNDSVHKIEQLFVSIKSQASQIDSNLNQSTDATQQKVLNQLKRLEKKLVRGEKKHIEEQLGQLQNVLHEIFPNGTFQERKGNFSDFYLKEGKGYFERCLKEFAPLNPDITVLKFNAE